MFRFLRKTCLYILVTPILLALLGAGSNQLVNIVNHDTFPVSVNEVKLRQYQATHETVTLSDGTVMLDNQHCVASNKTHLNFLGDIFDEKTYTQSIGDILIDLGVALWPYGVAIWGFSVTRKLWKLENRVDY
jgi:hypothetical protein